MIALALWYALNVAEAAHYTVLSKADSGPDTLREALTLAGPGDSIGFALIGPNPLWPTNTIIIRVLSRLPPLHGAELDTNGAPIEILGDGSLPPGVPGLYVSGASAAVRGLIVSNFPGHGIEVVGDSATIGGPDPDDGNTISGNGGSGIHANMYSWSARIEGNTVGVDFDGVPTGNCLSASAGPCAGIWSSGFGVTIVNNAIDDTQGSVQLARGSGILITNGEEDVVISDNEIGLSSGNAAHGIMLAGTTYQPPVIDGNIIGNNGRAGILLGAQTEHAQVIDNLIGFQADGLTPAGNANDGIHVFASFGHMIAGNTIGNSGGSGIRMNGKQGPIWHCCGVIADNTIGLDVSGAPAGNALYGIESAGEEGRTRIERNTIGHNSLGGISLADPGHTLIGNLIGTDADGADIGNGNMGVTLAASDIHATGNVVADNDGSGFRIHAPDGEVVTGIELIANRVGEGALYTAQGNAGVGIHVRETGTGVLSDVLLRDNVVAHNTDRGIWVELGERVRILENQVTSNGLCGVLVEPAANVGITPPTISHLNDARVTFSVAPPPAGITVRKVHVYWDPEDEARDYLGAAENIPGTNLWTMPQPWRAPFGRVSAIVEWSDGNTSGLAGSCADGCSANTNDTCNDGDPCTDDICDPITGCAHVAVPNAPAVACNDGDSCTLADVCVDGACQPGLEDADCLDDLTSEPLDRCKERAPGGGEVERVCDDSYPDTFCIQNECKSGVGCTPKLQAPRCDDRNDCTADTCDPVADMCAHIDRDAGFVCEDGNACTGWGTCDGGGLCADVDPDPPCIAIADAGCTAAVCDEYAGCSYPTSCGDGTCDPGEQLLPPPDRPNCATCMEDCLAPGSPLLDEDDDLDGLPDEWELAGSFEDCAGVVHPLADADDQLPNVYVELDYMVAPGHTHEPRPGVLAEIENTFLLRADHILNFDGDTNELPHHDVLRMSATSMPDPGCTDWVPFDQIKSDPANFAPWRRYVYHYVIMGHRMVHCGDSHSGFAEIGGNDFMVTLGTFDHSVGTYEQQRGTLTHELGHNFGLLHGGLDDINDKPNYVSSMNYLFQFSGLTEFIQGPPHAYGANVSDYSHAKHPTLHESTLDELTGITDTTEPTDSTLYWSKSLCPPESLEPDEPAHASLAPTGPHDWNCNEIDGELVAVDVNGDGKLGRLEGRDDWATLDLYFQCNASFADGAPRPDAPIEELTRELAEELGVLYPPVHPRTDLAPGCAHDHVATDGTGRLQVAVFGSDDLDVATIDVETLVLAGQPVSAQHVLDLDGDYFDDLVAEFDNDLVSASPPSVLELRGGRTNSQVVTQLLVPTWTSTSVDSDGDGVEDVCDACPTTPTLPADPDGCP